MRKLAIPWFTAILAGAQILLGDCFRGRRTCFSPLHTIYWKLSPVDAVLQSFPAYFVGECWLAWAKILLTAVITNRMDHHEYSTPACSLVLLFSRIYLAWCLGQPPWTFLTMQKERSQKYLTAVVIFSHVLSLISCDISRWQGTHCNQHEFGYQGSWKGWESVAELFPIIHGSCWALQWKRAFNFTPALEHRLNSKIE